MYTIVYFLASHPIVLIAIGATVAVVGALMPYVEKQMRPSEYIYVAWVQGMKSHALLDYQRFEWPHGENTVVLPVPEPKQLEVTGTTSASLMLLAPKNWGVEMWMGVEGMEPATRHRPNSMSWSISAEDLDTSGDAITREYLSSPKSDGIEYVIQGLEWWNTATWNETRRMQITKPLNP